jgi:hypothetical protein
MRRSAAQGPGGVDLPPLRCLCLGCHARQDRSACTDVIVRASSGGSSRRTGSCAVGGQRRERTPVDRAASDSRSRDRDISGARVGHSVEADVAVGELCLVEADRTASCPDLWMLNPWIRGSAATRACSEQDDRQQARTNCGFPSCRLPSKPTVGILTMTSRGAGQPAMVAFRPSLPGGPGRPRGPGGPVGPMDPSGPWGPTGPTVGGRVWITMVAAPAPASAPRAMETRNATMDASKQLASRRVPSA